MRRDRPALLVCALLALRCANDGAPAPAPTPAPTPSPDARPPLDAHGRCPVDPALLASPLAAPAMAAAALPASARVIEDAADLLPGTSAVGQRGDVLLANGHLRAVVQRATRSIGPDAFGGNLVDATLVGRTIPENDVFGEILPFFRFGLTADVTRVEVVGDGVAGGPALVAATGPAAFFDTVDIQGKLQQELGLPIRIPFGPDPTLPLSVTTWYALWPGAQAVRVVTAFCNHGDAEIDVPAGDLLVSGSDPEEFTPRTPQPAAGIAGFGALVLPWFAFFNDRIAYGYLMEPPTFATVEAAGVRGSVAGIDDIEAFLARDPAQTGRLVQIPPRGIATYRRDLAVVAQVADVAAIHARVHALPTGTVRGLVERADPAALVRVVARDAAHGLATALFTVAADGTFAGDLPAGRYLFSAAVPGLPPSSEIEVAVDDGAVAVVPALAPPPHTRLDVRLRDAAGAPSPGRVTALCDDACGPAPSADFGELGRRGVLGSARVAHADVAGHATLLLPPGPWRVVASRGIEYEPEEARVDLAGGDTRDLTLSLRRVVDSPGMLSCDTHVHAAASTDSTVAVEERVLGFLGEDVDLLISTDHDHHTDYAPVIAALGAGAHITSMIGVESTTFTYGHFNAFPLRRDATQEDGGALDWGAGAAGSLAPPAMFARLHALGDPVAGTRGALVQINHPRGTSYFNAVGLDLTAGTTSASPATFDIDPATVMPPRAPGDTGLYSDDFDAMEVFKSRDADDLFTLLDDLFAFWDRGHAIVGTGVSDTHSRFTGDMGVIRTYVALADDDPSRFDPAAFVTAFRAGAVTVTSGPLLRVHARAGEAAAVSSGDTISLPAGGGAVEVRVVVEAAPRFAPSRLLFYGPGSRRADGTAPRPLAEVALDVREDERLPGVEGGGRVVAEREETLTFTEDGWLLVLALGDPRADAFPVHVSRGAIIAAFANPVKIDVGGDGWRPGGGRVQQGLRVARRHRFDPGDPPVPLTAALLRRAVQGIARHGHE